MAKMTHSTASTLANATKRLIAGKGATIDQGVFLQEIMDVFGGPRELAIAMYADYKAAPNGGLARQKFMLAIQHLIISTTQFNMTKVLRAEQLTDEELQDALGGYLERISTGRLVPPAGADPIEGAIPPGGADLPGGSQD